jgi:hypothetical protein
VHTATLGEVRVIVSQAIGFGDSNSQIVIFITMVSSTSILKFNFQIAGSCVNFQTQC